jgi:hypothetical protein
VRSSYHADGQAHLSPRADAGGVEQSAT